MEGKTERSPHLVRNTVGGVVGNILEWYDFAVFGYFAPIIGPLFFPSEDKLASIISAFGVFAAGYLMRPLGGLLFGSIGDRLGRKKALQLSIMMMGIPTVALGLLPTHASIGVLAAVMLVVLRLLQGISVGGELIGSISFVTEIAPAKKRGYYGSWTLFSAIAGILLGSMMATVMHLSLSESQLHSWGWRVPFLAGFVVVVFGLWIRSGLRESEVFEKEKKEGRTAKAPVREAIRTKPGRIVHVMALVMGMAVGIYTLFVWWPTYLTKIIPHPIEHALLVNSISMFVMLMLIPVMGHLSDKVGRKRVLGGSFLAMAAVVYPIFVLTDHSAFVGALLCQLVLAVIMAGIQGTVPSTMVEMFPTRTRFSGVAMGYNVAFALFGGTAPVVSTWLIKHTNHDLTAPAYYVIGANLVSFVAVLLLRHKPGEKLE